jgi:glycerol-3-phosphate O-acyltransferase
LRKLQLFARFLKTYLESYRVVLAFLKQTPRSKTRGKDRMKKMHAIGRTMLKGEQIQLPESLSNINFENGISLFTFRNIKGSEDDELIQSYKKTIHNFLQLI